MKKKFNNNYKQLRDEETGNVIKIGDTVYVPRKRKNGIVERVAADETLLVKIGGEMVEVSFSSVKPAQDEEAESCAEIITENKRLKRELDECTMSLTLIRNPIVDIVPDKVRERLPETATENAVKKIVNATMTLVEESKNEDSYGAVIEAEQDIKEAVEDIKQNASRSTLNITNDCIVESVVVRNRKTIRIIFPNNKIPTDKVKDKMKKNGFSWYRYTAEEKEQKGAAGYWGAFYNEKRHRFAMNLCAPNMTPLVVVSARKDEMDENESKKTVPNRRTKEKYMPYSDQPTFKAKEDKDEMDESEYIEKKENYIAKSKLDRERKQQEEYQRQLDLQEEEYQRILEEEENNDSDENEVYEIFANSEKRFEEKQNREREKEKMYENDPMMVKFRDIDKHISYESDDEFETEEQHETTPPQPQVDEKAEALKMFREMLEAKLNKKK